LQFLDEAAKRFVRSFMGHSRNIHRLDDIPGMFDASDCRCDARLRNRLGQEFLVTVPIALPVRSLAAFSENRFESRRVEQQPSLDVRVGYGQNHSKRQFSYHGFDLAAALAVSLTVGIESHDEQVGPCLTGLTDILDESGPAHTQNEHRLVKMPFSRAATGDF
jgi:hypothetical protein